MRFVLSVFVALACFAGLSRACDYGACAVQVQAAPVVYAQPVVVQQAFVAAAPVQVQYAAPAVVAAPVYAAPAVVVAPRYSTAGPTYHQANLLANANLRLRYGSVAVVAAPAAVVQQDTVVRRGLLGRREVIRSRTVVR